MAKAPLPPALSRRQADQVVIKNRGLVGAQARSFRNLNILTYEELFSEGDMALVRASRKWPGQGHFCTYAVTAIRRAMLKAIKRRKFLGQEPLEDSEEPWIHTLTDTRGFVPDGVRIDMRVLNADEVSVITELYGLAGHARTVAQTAKKLKISQQQVEELTESAFEKLRRAIVGHGE